MMPVCVGCTRLNTMMKHLVIIQRGFLSNSSRFSSENSISEESQLVQSRAASYVGKAEQVVSFRNFIPLRVEFLNQPSKPNYLENVFTNKSYDVQLGCNLQSVLKMFIEKGRDEQAANILRNIICSGFLMEAANVSEMKDIFVNSLCTEFQNNILNYMDILIYFIRSEEHSNTDISDKNTPIFQLFKDSLNKALSRNSELLHRDRLEEKIVETSKRLAQYEDSAALSDLFHYEVAKTVIKRNQFEFLHFVNFACLTHDRAATLITKLVISKCYSEAIDLMITSNTQVERHVVFGLYKRTSNVKAKGSHKVSDEKLTAFENWMCKNGFESVIEELFAGGKDQKKNEFYEWNELDDMK